MLCLIFPTSILTTVSVVCVSTYLFKCNKNLGKIFDENPGFLTERQKRGKVGKNAWGVNYLSSNVMFLNAVN